MKKPLGPPKNLVCPTEEFRPFAPNRVAIKKISLEIEPANQKHLAVITTARKLNYLRTDIHCPQLPLDHIPRLNVGASWRHEIAINASGAAKPSRADRRIDLDGRNARRICFNNFCAKPSPQFANHTLDIGRQ